MKKLITLVLVVGLILMSACAFSGCNGNVNNDKIDINEEASSVLNEAQLINDENRDLIGKEIIDTNEQAVEESEPEDGQSTDVKEEIPQNEIIKEAEKNVVVPDSINVFSCDNTTTPEVIVPNGCCAVFVADKGSKGWNCKKGSTIEFNFEKYESEVIENQTIEVGCVKNGKMMEGQILKKDKGTYKYPVEETGVYAIYIVGDSSDPIALKNGTIVNK